MLWRFPFVRDYIQGMLSREKFIKSLKALRSELVGVGVSEQELIMVEKIVEGNLFSGYSKKIAEEYGYSLDVIKALQNLTTNTLGGPKHIKGVTMLKFEPAYILIGLLKKYRLAPELPVVYLAPTFDLEFPLLLGQRNIELVDPLFLNKKEIIRFMSRVSQKYTVRNQKLYGFSLYFHYSKLEIVNITLAPKQIGEYQPRGQIGVLLEFLSPEKNFLTKHSIFGFLVKNGLFYSDSMDLFSLNPEKFGFKREKVWGDGGIFSARKVTKTDLGQMEKEYGRYAERKAKMWAQIQNVMHGKKK